MDFRNPTYNAAGGIDLEIDHPAFGWIPFTASQDDPEAIGRELYAEAAAGVVAPYVPPPVLPAPPGALPSISDRQFFQALASPPWSLITTTEALDAVKTGEIPPAMQAFIAAMPAGEQFAATMVIAGATEFRRDHPLVDAFAQAQGLTAVQINDLWRFAAEL